MTKKVAFIWFVVVSIAAGAAMLASRKSDPLLPLTLKAIKTKIGWGYEIDVDGKIFIHQAVIPAIDGDLGFPNKEQALFVGDRVLAKLKEGRMPQITVAELEAWGIVKANGMQ